MVLLFIVLFWCFLCIEFALNIFFMLMFSLWFSAFILAHIFFKGYKFLSKHGFIWNLINVEM